MIITPRPDRSPLPAPPTGWVRVVLLRLGAVTAAGLFGLLGATAAASGVVLEVDPGVSPTGTEPIRFGVSPAPQDATGLRSVVALELGPGETARDAISVSNLGAEPLTVDLYPADTVMTSDGDVTVPARDVPVVGPGTWISLEVTEIVVPAGRRVDVPFEVAVPSDATPGDHVAAVLAALPRTAPTAEDSASLQVDVRAGVLVEVRVPGELRSALDVASVHADYRPGLGGLSGGSLTVSVEVHNPGNLRQGGVATVDVAAPWSVWRSTAASIAVPELLPGETVTVTGTISDVPAVVWAQVDVGLVGVPRDGAPAAPPVVGSTTVWLAPWLLGALLAAVVVLVRLRLRRRRRPPAAESSPASEAGVTVP